MMKADMRHTARDADKIKSSSDNNLAKPIIFKVLDLLVVQYHPTNITLLYSIQFYFYAGFVLGNMMFFKFPFLS